MLNKKQSGTFMAWLLRTGFLYRYFTALKLGKYCGPKKDQTVYLLAAAHAARPKAEGGLLQILKSES